MKRLITAVFLIGLTANIFAQGRIIIPEFPERPAYNRHTLQLKSVDANISIRNGLADVQLQQTFLNPSQYRLEGEYIFPIPENSQIHDFQLYVDGEKLAGEVLKAEEARQIYYDIVRRLRDPALLEYSENNLFRARIFPVEAGQERQLQISYSQVLEYDGGSYRFVLPIRQSGEGTIEKFHVNIHLVTQSPAANIYSPSHQIDVSRENDRSAKISFEASHLQGEKDLVLYYSLASQAIGGAMLSFRPRTDQDGYFVFMAEPVFETAQAPQLAKDVIFVIDVSGSMQGKKMEQAREALKFCVNALNPRDRFQIIHFSSVVNDFQNGLKYATEDAIGNADYFISNLSASGGTNINEALLRALRLKPQPDNRPTSIIFLTDGLPTEGETDIKKIISNIEEEGLNNIRIFNFGVGYDVNTFLLDKLAEIGHGTANYVKPGENIEKEVSSFFTKISCPVLTDAQIDFGQLKTYDVYPTAITDIFKGQRILIFGRYRAPGASKIYLRGRQNDKSADFSYSVELKERERENAFIANLWANRKVAHLLDQIRFNGENPELVESIRQLGKEYGIVTPYTSYLVREQEKELVTIQQRSFEEVSARRLQALQDARQMSAADNEESTGSAGYYQALGAAPKPALVSSGKSAVMASRIHKKFSSSDKDEKMLLTVRRVGDKTFVLKNGIWTDLSVQDSSRVPEKVIPFLSDAYFELSARDEMLSRWLSLGQRLIFEWHGKVYKIED